MTTDGAAVPPRRRTLDLVLVGGTAAMMLLAVVLRCIAAIERGSFFGHRITDPGARHAAVRPDIDEVTLANWASGAAGVGVLLLATTLVVLALRPSGGRFAMVVGCTAVALSLGAVAAAVMSSHAVDPGTAFRLDTWRTGLAAIAGACLPAVFAAAVRVSDGVERR
ncbi:hypothetical protein [Curtobacterium sp. RRHDQ10]|uniref:hypothetical protein n=1 Tax=Curtobacterium phyllosphaerae TaxID=3413379 RepID=UPI003BF13D00